MVRSELCVLLGCALPLLAPVANAEDAVLSAAITDAATGQPVPCVVSITDANGNPVIETRAFAGGFRCPGSFRKSLPPGRTQLRVTRGFETGRVSRDVTLVAGQETHLSIQLQRRVNLRERGWFGGDSHVHMIHGERDLPVDFDFVALTAQTEDLQYLSLCQAWQTPHPVPEVLERELGTRSTPACQLRWGMEAPKNYYRGDAGRCLGHCWLLAPRGRTADHQDAIQLLSEASAGDYQSTKPVFANFESHGLIHALGGTVFYTHPARWWMGSWGGQGGYPQVERMRISNMAVELPLDTVIGPTFDGLDVITSGGELEANEQAFALWALLLNHGYRVAATASSDACFDRPGGAVPGSARTYTYLADGFSWDAVARATAAGRTFVTTGPLVIATLNGRPPGTSFPASEAPFELQIEAWSSGKETKGLRAIEILRNGQSFQRIELEAAPSSHAVTLQIREPESAWYCVRVSGSTPAQRASTGAFFIDQVPATPIPPAPARVLARVVDAQTGVLLPATLTEIACLGSSTREGPRHAVKDGFVTVSIPATSRLRADSPGYAGATLSPVLDFLPLQQFITGLEAQDLLDWKTFERMRELLGESALTFALERQDK